MTFKTLTPEDIKAMIKGHAEPITRKCRSCDEDIVYLTESQVGVTLSGYFHLDGNRWYRGEATLESHMAAPLPRWPVCQSTVYVMTVQQWGNAWDCGSCGSHDYHSIGD